MLCINILTELSNVHLCTPKISIYLNHMQFQIFYRFIFMKNWSQVAIQKNHECPDPIELLKNVTLYIQNIICFIRKKLLWNLIVPHIIDERRLRDNLGSIKFISDQAFITNIKSPAQHLKSICMVNLNLLTCLTSRVNIPQTN